MGAIMNVNELTIEEKIGQMLCFAYHGTTMNSQIEYLINNLHIGGLISFARNITSIKQIAKLNSDIQEKSKIPLFLGLDQEGGVVRRVLSEITPLPGAMLLASGSSLEEVYEINNIVAKELKQIGFNMNFAPVADVNNNPLNPVINSRAYSDNPEIVAQYATYAALGIQDAKVIPTLKHFPGHGDTVIDSHLGLPVVSKTLEELEQIEMYPFQKAINANVKGIMLSHVMYKALDDKYPASMSKKIVTDLLKNKLGFTGLIVTDSLTMKAIANNYSIEEVILQSVNAGVDILIFCGQADLKEQIEIFNTFVRLVYEEKILLQRLNESVQKIFKFKQQFDIVKDKYKLVTNITFANEDNLNFALSLYEKGITYVGKEQFIPFKEDEKVIIIFPKVQLYTLVDNENDEYYTLGKYLPFKEIVYDEECDYAYIANVSKEFDRIIFCSYNVSERDYQSTLFSYLDKSKVVGVALRSPYDYLHLKGLTQFLLIYEPTAYALQTIKKVLMGEIIAKGKLPIKI